MLARIRTHIGADLRGGLLTQSININARLIGDAFGVI
jgi:hypothetical protein